jgi:hypothetical protein
MRSEKQASKFLKFIIPLLCFYRGILIARCISHSRETSMRSSRSHGRLAAEIRQGASSSEREKNSVSSMVEHSLDLIMALWCQDNNFGAMASTVYTMLFVREEDSIAMARAWSFVRSRLHSHKSYLCTSSIYPATYLPTNKLFIVSSSAAYQDLILQCRAEDVDVVLLQPIYMVHQNDLKNHPPSLSRRKAPASIHQGKFRVLTFVYLRFLSSSTKDPVQISSL